MDRARPVEIHIDELSIDEAIAGSEQAATILEAQLAGRLGEANPNRAIANEIVRALNRAAR